MKYSEAELGRTFVIRLEDGDILHESLERFCIDHSVNAASVTAVGGADDSSILITGPERGRVNPPNPMEHTLEGVHEITGTGTIFPDSEGQPVLHMHIASGRKDKTVTGCVRRGVKVWHVMEVILTELRNSSAKRLKDETTGFELMKP